MYIYALDFKNKQAWRIDMFWMWTATSFSIEWSCSSTPLRVSKATSVLKSIDGEHGSWVSMQSEADGSNNESDRTWIGWCVPASGPKPGLSWGYIYIYIYIYSCIPNLNAHVEQLFIGNHPSCHCFRGQHEGLYNPIQPWIHQETCILLWAGFSCIPFLSLFFKPECFVYVRLCNWNMQGWIHSSLQGV